MKKLIMMLLSCLLFIAYKGAYAYAATDCDITGDNYKSGVVTGVSIGTDSRWITVSNPNETILFWFKAKGATSESLYAVYNPINEAAGRAMYAQLAIAYALQVPARIEGCRRGQNGLINVYGVSFASGYGN